MKDRTSRFTLRLEVRESQSICDFLADHAPLSKLKIKDALVKGAATLGRKGKKRRRIRKAKFLLKPGDFIQFGYDEKILKTLPPLPSLIHKSQHFSVWFKPPGVFSQGTIFGDHCSIIRLVEKQNITKENILPVHRLDHDVAGVMLVAHGKKAAAALSEIFSQGKIRKIYLGIVDGKMNLDKRCVEINEPIDNRKAKTTIRVIETTADQSLVEIEIHSGRKHQIRKHLSGIGFPLLGDHLYNTDEKEKSQILLLAYLLQFSCPFSGDEMFFQLSEKVVEDFKNRLTNKTV